MVRKIVLAFVAVAIMATPAFAGNRPEFDAVGCDATNFFLTAVEEMVMENDIYDPLATVAVHINEHSAFDNEDYTTTAEQAKTDPCFLGMSDPQEPYMSNLTSTRTMTSYEWKIVLQMEPETDLDLDIRDCVMKHNQIDPWMYAEQTGRFRSPDGKLVFLVHHAQPLVTVRAYPGHQAHPNWTEDYSEHQKGVILKARRIPGGLCRPIDLDEIPYSSKALWEEGILIALPRDGERDKEARPMYQMRAGDLIKVTIDIPHESPVDIRYGEDNVMLRYVGVVGTEYITLDEDGYPVPCVK